ncbi:MAG: hypothetical protein FWB91_11235 [Defluviitaleaceae bacterium]|nr:hypothetical protein [Defluviitaleaceae bacterium]
MLFTEYLDSVENTDDEARLLEEIAKFKDDLAQAVSVPLVGKIVRAIAALGELGSIEAFKQSEHYHYIEGWDASIDLDKGMFSLYPGAEQRKTILKILAFIGAGIFFLWLFCKCKRRKKA